MAEQMSTSEQATTSETLPPAVPTSEFDFPTEVPQSGPSASEMLGVSSAPPTVMGQPGESEVPISAQEYGFDDDSVSAYDFEFYTGRQNQTDRLGILRDAGPFGARVHYTKIAALGYFVCLSEFKKIKQPDGTVTEVPVKLAICCKKVPDSLRKRFIVPVIKYGTQPNGELLKELTYKLMAWRYTDDKYIIMRNLNREFPLADHDILIQCTNEGWQKLTIHACKQKLIKLPKWPAENLAEINLWVESKLPKMAKTLGRRYTEAELLEKFGMVQPNQAAVAARDTPLMDLNELLR